MRITKKVVSLVLAILMVATMMSVMAVSTAFAATEELTLSGSDTITISTGGTYKITGTTTATPAVAISTTEPVVIVDSDFATTSTDANASALSISVLSGDITVQDSTITTTMRGINMTTIATAADASDLSITIDNTKILNSHVSDYANDAYTATTNGARGINLLNADYNVTVKNNSEIKGFKYSINEPRCNSQRAHTVTVTNSTIYGWGILNSYSLGGTYNFTGCDIRTINKTSSAPSNRFAAFVFDQGSANNTLTIDNCSVVAVFGTGDASGNPHQNMFFSKGTNNAIIIKGANTVVDIDDSRGDLIPFTSYDDNGNTIEIQDGTFNCAIVAYPVANYEISGGTFNNVVYSLSDVEISGGTFNEAVVTYLPESFDSTLNISGGTFKDVVDTTASDNADANITISGGTFSDDVPVEYLDNKVDVAHNGDGTYTVETSANTYVARVGNGRYTSYAGAIAELQDNDTIVLLADTGNDVWSGPSINGKKNITLELNGKTLKQRFNVFNSELTIKDSSDEQTGAITCTNWIDLRGANLTIESGTFNTEFSDLYLYSNNPSSVTVKGGTFNGSAYEGLIRLGGDSSTIKIEGGTFNGISRDYQDKTLMRAGYIYIYGGDMSNNHTRVNVPCGTVSTSIYGGKFHKAVPAEYCASGYVPTGMIDNSYYTVEYVGNPLDKLNTPSASINDGNAFGIKTDYLMGTLLGVQAKSKAGEETSSQEGTYNMRFVACLDTDILQSADDYGFVVAKLNDSKDYSNTNINGLAAFWGNGEKTVSAKDTYNNVCGTPAYGDPTDNTTDYKYITCAINNVSSSDKFVARFYVQIDGKYYYAKYSGQNYQYTGCIASWSDVFE